MTEEQYFIAKRNNDRAGLAIFFAFLVWLPTYLLVARPLLNSWLRLYINSYPAALHLIPIVVPLVVFGYALTRLYPRPPERRSP